MMTIDLDELSTITGGNLAGIQCKADVARGAFLGGVTGALIGTAVPGGTVLGTGIGLVGGAVAGGVMSPSCWRAAGGR